MKRRDFLKSSLSLAAGTIVGGSLAPAERIVPQTEAVIETTLSKELQDAALTQVARSIANQVKSKSLPANADVAMVCLDNTTGDILAYIPSHGASKLDHARRTQRDIGSIAKPPMYAIGLMSGAFPASATFFDTPQSFARLDGGGVCAPGNYGDSYTEQLLTIPEAIQRSSNVCAMAAYLQIQPSVFQSIVAELGLPEPHNLNQAAIGDSWAATVLEVAGAYPALVIGRAVRPRFERSRTLADGTQQVTEPRFSKPVFSDAALAPVQAGMRQCLSSGTGMKASRHSTYAIGKTGSSTHDAWAVLVTRQITAVTVVFRDSEKAQNIGQTGGSLAMPLLSNFFTAARRTHPELFPNWPIQTQVS